MGWLKRQLDLARGAQTNLSSMEGLRGFAVFLVFLVHYATLIGPWLPPGGVVERFARGMHAVGNIGVDLFFVLSGYLIYGALIVKARPFFKFIARRIERIYPTFLVVLMLYLALSLMFPAESKIPQGAVEATLFLLANVLLLPGLLDIRPVITVAWTLSYEMFYYLTIPLLIGVLRLRTWSSSARFWFFLSFAALLAAFFAWQGGHVRLLMFLSGILLWEALHGLKVRGPGSIAAFISLGLALATMLLPGEGSISATLRTLLLFVAFFVLCFSCFSHPQAWAARIFSWTPLRWLGNISYSYYLIHGLALKFVFMLFAKAWPADQAASGLFVALLLPAFALTLVPAFALFVLIERPLSLKPAREVSVHG